MIPPSALITGHGGYLYLSKLHRYLSGDEKSVVLAKPVESLTERFLITSKFEISVF